MCCWRGYESCVTALHKIRTFLWTVSSTLLHLCPEELRLLLDKTRSQDLVRWTPSATFSSMCWWTYTYTHTLCDLSCTKWCRGVVSLQNRLQTCPDSLPFCSSFSWACLTMAHCLDRTLKCFSTSPSWFKWLSFDLICNANLCSCGRHTVDRDKAVSALNRENNLRNKMP